MFKSTLSYDVLMLYVGVVLVFLPTLYAVAKQHPTQHVQQHDASRGPHIAIPFSWSCRVATSNKSYSNTTFEFKAMGTSALAKSVGVGWTPVQQFSAENITSAKKQYPNTNIASWFPGLVVHLSVSPLINNGASGTTDVECKCAGKQLQGSLFGGVLGWMVSTNPTLNPVPVQTFADFNTQRYLSVFNKLPKVQRPQHFPIVDRFIGGDDDLLSWSAGIAALSRLGLNGISVEPISSLKVGLLKKNGQTLTSGAVYSPPGGASIYNDSALALWAQGVAKPYTDVGYGSGDVTTFALADEPGWYWPSALPNVTNHDVYTEFITYLKLMKITPAAIGFSSWTTIAPSAGRGVGGLSSSSLQARTLYYWTMRFSTTHETEYFARSTKALETAFNSPGMRIYSNFNNFAARFYVPGPIWNNRDKTNTNAAMLSFDWFEFARKRGTTLLWSEDWFGDQQAQLWSFLGSKLRSAAAVADEGAGVSYGGYIVPRAGGQLKNGALLKAASLIGSGAKALKYFTFGPEYNFPGNCYSEDLVGNPSLLASMANAHNLIAKAEPLLWPGIRPSAQVAVLYPRSSELWDEQGVPLPQAIRDATITNPIDDTVDYFAEVYGVYDALAIRSNIPVDFIDETSLLPSNGESDYGVTLNKYKMIVITQPNIPVAALKAVVAWAQAGGTLLVVGNAGVADEVNTPTNILYTSIGVDVPPRDRVLASGALPVTMNLTMGDISTRGLHQTPTPTTTTTTTVTTTTTDATPAPIRGGISKITSTSGERLLNFTNGDTAVVRNKIGKGTVYYTAFNPGVSHAYGGCLGASGCGWCDYNGSLPMVELLTNISSNAGVVNIVNVNNRCVESPVLQGPLGDVVTLLNWHGVNSSTTHVNVTLAYTPSKVVSAQQGALKAATVDGVTMVSLPFFETADFISFYK